MKIPKRNGLIKVVVPIFRLVSVQPYGFKVVGKPSKGTPSVPV
jgi:hypothetical protein|tara:strand:+ start:701 stop:829 length:129 start_codon:yes stop_codon:yes gene_type:complete